MNKNELQEAFDLAKSDTDLTLHDFDVFFGFGLPDFEPVSCTIQQVARLIRWQCQYLNGQWDMEAFDEIRKHGRKKFLVF